MVDEHKNHKVQDHSQEHEENYQMVQNLWWAAGYNIFAIPLAAGVLANWGASCSPRPSARC